MMTVANQGTWKVRKEQKEEEEENMSGYNSYWQ